MVSRRVWGSLLLSALVLGKEAKKKVLSTAGELTEDKKRTERIAQERSEPGRRRQGPQRAGV